MMIRRIFEANKKISNIKEVEILLGTTEYLLAAYANPSPIIPIDSPGGTRFERNIPFPEEVLKPSNLVGSSWSYSI
jgi:NADH dehydrogenase (ubiquinone) 1 beta subcomplex subunit 9